MLFGEYSLLYGSGALTVPFKKHVARLVFPFQSMSEKQKKVALHSNNQLRAYHDFLDNDAKLPGTGELMNLDRFAEELAQGLYLHSTIPSGYGLGSSGALVAALFDKYARETFSDREHFTTTELQWLKGLFSRFESFFHGSSSGIDPLCIFVQKPLLISSDQSLSLTDLPKNLGSGTGGFFLVNTYIPRKTADLVSIFKKKTTDAAFKKTMLNDYIKCNDACIHSVTNQPGYPSPDNQAIEGHMQQLSQMQFDLFPEMIPGIFRPLWQEGLTSGAYSMKLCGAGGGGYLLGYAGDYAKAAETWQKHTVKPVTLNGEEINPRD